MIVVAFELPVLYRVLIQGVRSMSNKQTGTVKWFNNDKGYGFAVNESGEDVFIHYRAIMGDQNYKTLAEGQCILLGVSALSCSVIVGSSDSRQCGRFSQCCRASCAYIVSFC